LIIILFLLFLILSLPEILKRIFKQKILKNESSKKIIPLNDEEANFLPIKIYKEIPEDILSNEYLLKEKLLNNQEFRNKYNDIIVVDCIENINSQNDIKTTEGKFKTKKIENFLGYSNVADTGEIIQEVITEIKLDNGLKITKVEYKSKYELNNY
jgi:hypothetical protein